MVYSASNTKICVIGGGNIGTQFACAFANRGYSVNILSSRPQMYDGELEIVDENGSVVKGRAALVTSDYAEAVRGCRLILVTHPAFRFGEIASKLLPLVGSGRVICAVPGTGGAEFSFRSCIEAGASLCGLQRVPSVARLEQYGKRVRCEGLRGELYLGSIPSTLSSGLCELMSFVWGIPCYPLPNYLSVTLTPSNPILHTTRLRTLFADYEEGRVYDRNPLFYGEWTDESSELLIACDSELQEMLGVMDRLDLRDVRSLRLHYESDTVRAMTEKLRSIKSLHNLPSPMKKAGNGWIPDFDSRYFTADFPYGLAIIEELAEVIGYDAPNIRATMEWYRRVTGDTGRLDLGKYGIRTLEDIYSLY